MFKDYLKDIDHSLNRLLAQNTRHQEQQSSAVVLGQLFQFRKAHSGKGRPLAWWSERSFSQNGEDGIVAEIFSRLNRKLEIFVEIGAGDGLENNTIRWLLDGARGKWIERDETNTISIVKNHKAATNEGRLLLQHAMVTVENVNDLVVDRNIPKGIDLLSIDIDGNDYWIWKAIHAVNPRVVIIEYNARFGSTLSWVMDYDPDYVWPGGICYFGASLKALEKLGQEMGYSLIGVDFMGVNAFFLRNDLLDESIFSGPYTAEALFQPFRRGLGQLPTGKAPAFGPYVNP